MQRKRGGKSLIITPSRDDYWKYFGLFSFLLFCNYIYTHINFIDLFMYMYFIDVLCIHMFLFFTILGSCFVALF